MKRTVASLVREHFEREVAAARTAADGPVADRQLVGCSAETIVNGGWQGDRSARRFPLVAAAALIMLPGVMLLGRGARSPLAEHIDQAWEQGGRAIVNVALEEVSETLDWRSR